MTAVRGLIICLVLTSLSALATPSVVEQPAQTQFCGSLLPIPAGLSGLELLRRQHWQEALWQFQKEGNAEQAETLEAAIKDELLNGQVLAKRLIKKIRGVYKITFSYGIEAIFKSTSAEHPAEVLAFELDQALNGIAKVPLTVRRSDDELKGTLQLYIPRATRATRVPVQLWLFDKLTGNLDRKSGQNIIRTSQGDVIAIDNEDAQHLSQDSVSSQKRLDWQARPKRYSTEEIRDLALSVDQQQIIQLLQGKVHESALTLMLQTLLALSLVSE